MLDEQDQGTRIGVGVAPERAVLRKPESTTGDGSNQEARRVEVRIVD